MEPSAPPKEETLYHSGNDYTTLDDDENHQDNKTTIVLSHARVHKEYSPRCFCWAWPPVMPLVLPQLLQQQGVPEALWQEFCQDLTVQLQRFQAVYRMLVVGVCVTVWALLHFHKKSKTRRDSDNDHDEIAWWLFFLILFATLTASLLLILLVFWSFHWMTLRGWSYGMDTFVLAPLLQKYQPIFRQ
eukprot:CAMPEP_0168820180 /NCGR_PEP_ID=MMETSP0726-20121227/8699_1 /TAXON_ID=265536 /ORGANISM="Amphiprora sp., Strain CCMP467" /LENGTH=186 /DNA_ID=CAMNT_0008872649 /DNA_START=17 /DNA_END=574 /DNA_ORIENTATION=+